jgi:hypothetical protein
LIVLGFGFFPTAAVEDLIRPAAEALIDRSGYIAAVLGGGR